jgi:hypothetical protein
MINDLWYKNAIIYCLSVSTFMDADGDGIGDFPGLMNRLDYLQGIGVGAIWLWEDDDEPCSPGTKGKDFSHSSTVRGCNSQSSVSPARRNVNREFFGTLPEIVPFRRYDHGL